MEIKFKNPLRLKDENNNGDPFITRWNGWYYLFLSASTRDTIPTFYKSKDLINWEYLGYISDDPVANCGYAPEIVYAYGKFYLCTSPFGNGHYIFVSDNIEGPYKRITENQGHMIDGSFVLDGMGKLHFVHATINGISYCDVDDKGIISNQRNAVKEMECWTEGPSIIQRKGMNYLFYCGNHLYSKGYRINCAVSKTLEGPYVQVENNPIQINAEDGYTRLGHCSEVLTPDLLNYEMAYHSLPITGKPRVCLLDKINFDGDIVSVSHSDFDHVDFSSPDFENDDFTKLSKVSRFYLSDDVMDNRFVLEGHLNEKASLVFGYVDDMHFSQLDIVKNIVQVLSFRGKNSSMVFTKKTDFDFSYMHSIRIEKDITKAYLYIDNAFVGEFNINTYVGNAGYFVQEGAKVGYLAFSNSRKNEELEKHPMTLPGIVGGDHLYIENCMSIFYQAGKKQNVFVSINCNAKTNTKIKIGNKEYNILKNDSPYEFITIPLGMITIKESGKLDVDVLEGEINIRFIKFDGTNRTMEVDNIVSKNDIVNGNEEDDSYYFSKKKDSFSPVSIDFTLDKIQKYEGFGIILNANQYSPQFCSARYHFNGIMLDLFNGVFRLYDVRYEKHYIFDRGYKIEPGVKYNLKIEYKNYQLFVYLNGELVFNKYFQSVNMYGLNGIMVSPYFKGKIQKIEL